MDQDQGRCARLVEGSCCYVEAACRLAGMVDHCADHYACREGREGMAHFSPYRQAAGTAGPCRAASTDRGHQGRQETVLARLSLCRWEGMVVHQDQVGMEASVHPYQGEVHQIQDQAGTGVVLITKC